ncbi:Blue-light-activated protein [bacterium HR11]|nr:Blue-light-activated protein [bacterium HR11]
MDRPLRILILEDVPTDAELVEWELRRAGLVFTSRRVDTEADFRAALDDFEPDVILADYSLPQFDAMAALRILRDRASDVPFILVTGSQGEEVAVECIKAGAADYILKTSLTRLPTAVQNALERRELERARRRAEEELRYQLTRMHLLNRIVRAIAERQDVRSILEVTLQYLEEHMPVAYAGIGLYDEATQTVRVLHVGPRSRALAEAPEVGPGAVVSVDPAVLRRVVEDKVLYIPDLPVDSPLYQKLVRAGIHSVVTVPLLVDGRLFGLLAVFQPTAYAFSPADLGFLQALGEHVALAIQHARILEDLQRAYEDLRQTQRAVMQQERLRALGQMASGIVHDINNALSPILGYVELLLETEPDLNERVRRQLEIVKTAAADIAHIVARIREFYRSRGADETLFPVDLNRVAEQAVDLTRPRWRDIPQERGLVIEVRMELEPGLPTVLGQEGEIREAVVNLILNAVDAMPRGGVLTIRTFRRGDRVALEVQDTGVGMDEETRRRCLEPFFTTKGKAGTGLGLAVVYGVMQRHEGDIQIESELGRGTTVRLVFPLPTGEAGRPRPPAEEGGPLERSLRVLVVDDEPLLRELMKEILQGDGHEVEVADGGQAGLDAFHAALARGTPFDVVITDLGMPYVDGRAVATAVKQASPATPVILMTGWGTRLKAEAPIPPVIDYVLEKPPKFHEVRRALRQVVRLKHT